MRYGCRFVVMAIATMLLLRVECQAVAYFPIDCFSKYAKDDFKESASVVIGRVTAVERYRYAPSAESTKSEKGPTGFFYLATITVGQTLKGKAKAGDEILFFTGSYLQREEDNVTPTILRVANTHPAWTLECDHIYLLALNPEERANEWKAEVRRDGQWVRAALENREIWHPRSCHWSVHEITVRKRWEPGNITDDGMHTVHMIPETSVTVYFDRWQKPIPRENHMPLGEFLAAQEKGVFPGDEPQAVPATDPAAAKPGSGPLESDTFELYTIFLERRGDTVVRKRGVLKLKYKAIEQAPAWEMNSANPPVSAEEAVEKAGVATKGMLKNDDDWVWGFESATLVPLSPRPSGVRKVSDHWYWLVTYEALPTGEEGMAQRLQVAVLMDGTVVRPATVDLISAESGNEFPANTGQPQGPPSTDQPGS